MRQENLAVLFTVYVDGRELGQIGGMVIENQLLSVDGRKLAQLMRPVAPPDLVAAVRAVGGADQTPTIYALRQLKGMSLAYDLPKRRLDIWLAPPIVAEPEVKSPREWPKSLNLPLFVDRAYAGDIGVTLDGPTVSGMDAVRLTELLQPRVAPSVLSAVQVASGADRIATFDEMKPVRGIAFAYDPELLRIDATLLAEAKPVGDISASPVLRQRHPKALPPDSFAAALSVNASIDYVHESTIRPREVGEASTAGVARLFASLGGFEGLAGAADIEFDTRDDTSVRRGPVTLIKDDYDSAIRYAALDISAPATSFQIPLPIGGVGVARSFADLQPARNVRPGGSGRFVLERASLVQVEVNGVIVRTLRLNAGTYDIRDFALTEGVNDVRLFVEDETGRREVANFSLFFTGTLLEKGLSEFGLAAGAPRTATADGVDYDADAPLVTGFYRRGISDAFTAGANFQADEKTQVAGVEVDAATAFGAIRFEAAASQNETANAGYAARAGWRINFGGERGFRTGELEAVAEGFTENYRQIASDLPEPRAWEAGVRYRQTIFDGVGVSAGHTYTQGRTNAGDERRTSASVSRSFGRFSVLLSFDRLERPQRKDEDQALVSLSWRVGERGLARARYQSARDTFALEYDRPSQELLHEVGVRLSAVDSDLESDVEGEIDYVGNRFDAGYRADALMDPQSGAMREVASSARLGFGVGTAGGAWGLGRAPRDAFAVVSAHDSLDDRNVKVSRRSGLDHTLAETGALGAVLVPLDRPYQNDVLQVAVDDLPAGYDLGAGRFELFPGQWTGYDLEVGSEAANTIMGVLEDDAGRPVSLMSGRLLNEADPVAAPVEFFTNRTGRFVAERARPGAYRLVLPDGRISDRRIVVPPSASGLVRAGVVRLGA